MALPPCSLGALLGWLLRDSWIGASVFCTQELSL